MGHIHFIVGFVAFLVSLALGNAWQWPLDTWNSSQNGSFSYEDLSVEIKKSAVTKAWAEWYALALSN
jgi:hypothetical protein